MLPVSRDWVTAIICLNSHLQTSLFLVRFLTCSWFNFPEGSLTWESGVLLSVTEVSDYQLVPFNTVHWVSLSFSMTSPLAQTLSLPHSLLPALHSVPFLLLMSILSSGALSLDSPCDICFHIPKNFLHCYHCFTQQTLLLHFWCTSGESLNTYSSPHLRRTILKGASWLQPNPSVCSDTCLYAWMNGLFMQKGFLSTAFFDWVLDIKTLLKSLLGA